MHGFAYHLHKPCQERSFVKILIPITTFYREAFTIFFILIIFQLSFESAFHVKISYLISSANQMTGFYIKSNTKLELVRIQVLQNIKLQSSTTIRWSFPRTT